jgi:cold shock protein
VWGIITLSVPHLQWDHDWAPPRAGLFIEATHGRAAVMQVCLRPTVGYAGALEALGDPAMARGMVKWFNSQKGYGFIQPQDGGKDVFVHISAVERAGLPGLSEGQTVEFELVSNRGKTSAENLKVSR